MKALLGWRINGFRTTVCCTKKCTNNVEKQQAKRPSDQDVGSAGWFSKLRRVSQPIFNDGQHGQVPRMRKGTLSIGREVAREN
jgi:hypothetical protein